MADQISDILTQNDRPFRLKTNLGDDALLLTQFEGYEAISQPFEIRVQMAAAPATVVDFTQLLGQPGVITIDLADGSERNIHGIFNRFSIVEYSQDGLKLFEGNLVPWFWFLTRFSDCRIFQKKTIPQIIEQVFADRGYSDYTANLTGTYAQREYTVQYRETDFNFVSRLMEQEGISYHFEHTVDKHNLVLWDAKTANQPCPSQSDVRYFPTAGSTEEIDYIYSLRYEQRLFTGKVSLADYDFEKPAVNLQVSSGAGKGEDYDYPGLYITKDDGDRYAGLKLDEREARQSEIEGRSNVRTFVTGFQFTLSEYIIDAANIAYLLTSVKHVGRNTPYRAGHSGDAMYANTFTAIPADTVYRPPIRAVKPTIKSSQTAVVVGPSGEEIYTDKYGRVKVQFFWDRQGTFDENSSCWMRVSHAWAGKTWGAIYLPRIDQEVIVSFLEGDPDQPIITGRVYNADQTIPYTLPDNMTKSTLKSMSSKGGGGYNEFRFEDLKGSEEIFLHGEKDYNIVIKNDRKEQIGNDRHLTVVRDKYESIQRDSHSHITRDQMVKVDRDNYLTVMGKEAISITATRSVKVGDDVTEEFGGAHSEKVSKDYYLKAANIVLEVDQEITLKASSGDFITVGPAGVTIKGSMVMINSGGAAGSGSPGTLVAPVAPTDATAPPDSTAGQTSTADTASPVTPSQWTVGNISPATRVKHTAAADAPAPAPAPAASGSSDSQGSGASSDQQPPVQAVLTDENNTPIAGEPFRVDHADGTATTGTTDKNGQVNVKNPPPGKNTVSFPNLDGDTHEQTN